MYDKCSEENIDFRMSQVFKFFKNYLSYKL